MQRLLIFFLLATCASAIEITQFAIVYENSNSYLEIGLAPSSMFENLEITPELAAIKSEGKFSIAKNISMSINITNSSSLFEIDRNAIEDVFSPSERLWCGSVFDTCGNCAGMPAGTFKWCNGAYPLVTYSCDNWCYTYTISPGYEKSQTGAFVKNSARVVIEAHAAGKTEISLGDENSMQQANEVANADASVLQTAPSLLPILLLRSKNSQEWMEISKNDYQNYKNELMNYYGTYLASIASAKSATDRLNGAIGRMVSNGRGKFSGYYSREFFEYPKITLKLRSDFAGVVALRGMPKIGLVSTQAKFADGKAYYEAEFENAGYAAETFAGNLSCGNGSAIWQTSIEFLENGKFGKMKFFVGRMESPTICSLKIFVLGFETNFDEIAATFEPFRQECPSEHQCCSNSLAYLDKACPPQESFRQEDAYGNGAYYMQDFVCENFICKAGASTITRRISGNLPPAQNTVSFASSGFESPKSTPTPQPSKEIEIKKEEANSEEPKKPTAPKKIEIKDETIEIIVPEHAPQGYLEIAVKVNDKPASGDVEVVSPAGKEYAFRLDLGSAQVLLNEEGEWAVKYKEEKRSVFAENLDAKKITEDGGNGKNAAGYTAFLSLGTSKLPFTETALVLIFAAFGFAGIRRHSEKVHFKKSFENNIVRLEIFNNLADLQNLEITDIVPEGQVLSTISNPPSEVTEIIFGKHIKWKKEKLGKGERMLISYSIFANSKAESLRAAEFEALSDGNKKVKILSNAILQ